MNLPKSQTVFEARARLEGQLQQVLEMEQNPHCTKVHLDTISQLKARINKNIALLDEQISSLSYPLLVTYSIDETTLN